MTKHFPFLLLLLFLSIVKATSSSSEGLLEPLIVGGEPAPVKTAVALFVDRKYFCAGTAVTGRYVLTAAHCFKEEPMKYKNAKDVFVLGGEENLLVYMHNLPLKGVLSRGVMITLHPDVIVIQHHLYHFDIALLEVETNLLLSSVRYAFLPPLSLTGEPLELNNTEVTLGGWGKKGRFSSLSKEYLEVNDSIRDDTECLSHFSNDQFLPSSMFCVGRKGRTACKGDSGSGVISYKYGVPVILGVISFATENCNTPTVSMRVETVIDWIRHVTEGRITTVTSILESSTQVPTSPTTTKKLSIDEIRFRRCRHFVSCRDVVHWKEDPFGLERHSCQKRFIRQCCPRECGSFGKF